MLLQRGAMCLGKHTWLCLALPTAPVNVVTELVVKLTMCEDPGVDILVKGGSMCLLSSLPSLVGRVKYLWFSTVFGIIKYVLFSTVMIIYP